MTQSEAEPFEPAHVEGFNLASELVWPDDVGADAEAVNQFVVAWDQDLRDVLYLYFGHVAPPPWLSAEIATERIQALGNQIAVQPKGSFMLSRTRAEQLWSVLGRHLGKDVAK